MSDLTEDEEEITELDLGDSDEQDPAAEPLKSHKLFTQPYDLTLKTLIDQIRDKTLHLRPLSEKPAFQRRYVWSDRLASRLIESIILNVPIPPCYLAQNEDFELEVIDGQQRIFSIHRFLDNQFRLSGLEALPELNGKQFFELDTRLRNKLQSHTLRCVVITNDSDEELRFDVFQRLNSNTVPLNAQELRNCVYRGKLIDLLPELAADKNWLKILRRPRPDKRMRGEELVLRFVAFHRQGLSSYKTPQKYWLNDMAKAGRNLSDEDISRIASVWREGLAKALYIFEPEECFRRAGSGKRVPPVNKALVDLNLVTLAAAPPDVSAIRTEYRERYWAVLEDAEFSDLIAKSVDHRTRTRRRFAIWSQYFSGLF